MFVLIVNKITIAVKKEIAMVLRHLVKIRNIIANYESRVTVLHNEKRECRLCSIYLT